MRLLQPLFALFASATDSQLAKMVEYLKAENRILRDKLPRRLTITPRERNRLVKLGSKLGSAIRNLITIVTPRAFSRWVAAGRARPRIFGSWCSSSPAKTAGGTRGCSGS
jgi:putative transposase